LVAVESFGSQLVVGDMNGAVDVFVRNRVAHTTELASVGRAWPLQAGRLVLAPRPARAGRLVAATLPILAGGSTVVGATVHCRATLDGHRLPVTARGFHVSIARCAWLVPADARGKQLHGSVTATNRAGTASKP